MCCKIRIVFKIFTIRKAEIIISCQYVPRYHKGRITVPQRPHHSTHRDDRNYFSFVHNRIIMFHCWHQSSIKVVHNPSGHPTAIYQSFVGEYLMFLGLLVFEHIDSVAHLRIISCYRYFSIIFSLTCNLTTVVSCKILIVSGLDLKLESSIFFHT